MKNFSSFDDFKRYLYLWMISLILIALSSFYLYAIYRVVEPFTMLLTRILVVWYVLAFILVYKKRLIRVVELVTLVVISFTHIMTMYTSVEYYMVPGMEGAVSVYIVWLPALILSFFLILKEKLGLIFSLSVFLINLVIGLMNFHLISHDYKIQLIQFYIAYLFYIFIFFLSRYFFRILSEYEVIKRYAYQDTLTGLANRHQIDKWLNEQKATSNNEQLSIIFFDLDYFKTVNDTYGHQTGDFVLTELASIVKPQLSDDDLFGRWGGEEFIILSKKSGETAKVLAETLRQRISNYYFTQVGSLTASFGVTEYKKGESVEDMLNRADLALYQSKKEGRNRVTYLS